MTLLQVTHVYDGLNRLVSTQLPQSATQTAPSTEGASAHTYEYDSLGNLLYEKDGTKAGVEYWYNNLNQMVRKSVGGKVSEYSFDKRGNLVEENAPLSPSAVTAFVTGGKTKYTYDVTNRLVKGEKENGEKSSYIYNGLGDLVGTEKLVWQNLTGFYNVEVNGVLACDDAWDMWIGSSGGLQLVSVIAEYTLDYTSTLKDVIMENGIRYTYGLQKIGSSDGKYYHQDRLGSVVEVSNNAGAVVASVEYDDWGVPNKPGYAEYTGHMWDDVLGMWYARARMYDSGSRRFVSKDEVKDGQNWYVYCADNPVGNVDPTGYRTVLVENYFDQVTCFDWEDDWDLGNDPDYIQSMTRGAQDLYIFPDSAAINFCNNHIKRTYADGNERGAMIFQLRLYFNSNKKALVTRYIYPSTHTGVHGTVWWAFVKEAFLKHYSFTKKWKDANGVYKVKDYKPYALAHTHPYCNGHANAGFSTGTLKDTGTVDVWGMTYCYVGQFQGKVLRYEKGQDKYGTTIYTSLPKPNASQYILDNKDPNWSTDPADAQ